MKVFSRVLVALIAAVAALFVGTGTYMLAWTMK